MMRATPHPQRFRYLLAAELALILLHPFLSDPRDPLFALLAMPTVVAGIYVVAADRRVLAAALVLGVLAIAGHFAAGIEGFHGVGLACSMVFCLLVLVVVLHAVFTSADVTMDTVCGAIAAYLMIGVVWGIAYALLDIVAPGSFHSLVGAERFTLGDFQFFSFVTLTSVGYGDMVPLSGHAKSLAIIESVGGVMFPAVLIGRLIALYGQARRHD